MATPRRSFWRHPIVIVLGAIVALFAVAAIVLAIAFPPARLKSLVSAQLSKTLAREVKFADVRLGLWPPIRLTVTELEIAEPGGLAAGAAFQAGSIHLDLAPLSLLARRVEVTRLVLDRPALHLVLRADGTTNFDGMMKPPTGGGAAGGGGGGNGGMDLAIREFSIHDGQVLVDDLKATRRVAFGLDTRTSLSLRDGGKRIGTTGETTISQLSFGPLTAAKRSDLNASLAKLDWKITHDGAFDAASKRLALSKLALQFGRTELGLKGVIDDPGPHQRVDLEAKASRVDLAEILSFVSTADAHALAGIHGAGTLDLDLKIRGTPAEAPASSAPTALLTTLKVLGTVSLADAAFRYDGAPAGVEGLNLTANFEDDAIRVPKITARVAGQPVTASLGLEHFADPIAQFTVNGDLDLGAVGPLVAPKGMKLGGKAAVAVNGRGRVAEPAAVALEGQARLAGVTVEGGELPKKVERVDGVITFSQTRATVKGLTAHAGGSSFTMDATVTRPLALMAKPGSTPPSDVKFTLVSPGLDLAELLPPTPGGNPLTPNATGTGRIEIARFKQQKLEVSNLKADLALTPGIVTVPSFTMTAYGGAITGDARFDVNDPAKPRYTVKTKIDKVDANQLLSAWTPAKGILGGSLTTTLDLAGVGTEPDDVKRSLTAIGLAAIGEGTLGPTPALQAIASLVKMPSLSQLKIKDGQMPFHVAQGKLVTENVAFHGSSGDWKLAGAVGFDGALDYAVSTTIPAEIAKQLGSTAALAAGALADEQGRILVDLKVGGTTKSPKVSWDSRAMQARLSGQASKALDEQRAKIEQQLAGEAEAWKKALKDSSSEAIDRLAKTSGDSLKKTVKDLFKGLFGKPPKNPPPPPAASRETSATADSTK